ncbi:hypothetical protein ACVWXP_007386 [Bradyrhizobium sp. USDA 4463]
MDDPLQQMGKLGGERLAPWRDGSLTGPISPDGQIANLQSGTCSQRERPPPDRIDLAKTSEEKHMKLLFTAAFVAAMALASASGADAKGCIKGAIVGGVAGHMAGHGKLGAAAGCAIGHHEANKQKTPNDSNAQAPSGQK